MKIITKTEYPINGTNKDKINYIKRNRGKQCNGLFNTKYYYGILCGFVISNNKISPLINKPFSYNSIHKKIELDGWNIKSCSFDGYFLGTKDNIVFRIETLEIL